MLPLLLDRARLAAAVGLALVLAAPAHPQTPDAAGPGPSAPSASACGGLPTGTTVFNTVRGLFGRKAPSLLSSFRAGPYCPSSQAIGLERDVDNQRADRFAIVHAPALTAYANALLERLKEATTLTGVPGAVYVIGDPGLSARASADGNIYVSIGWLRTVDSEDALVALLAHELAHIVLAHFESDVFTSLQKQLQTVAGVGMSMRRSLENQQFANLGKGSVSPQDQQRLRRMQVAIEVSDRVLHPAWNRRQEQEADRLALDLTQRLGYSYARGVKTFLERIADWEEEQNAKAEARKAELQQVAATDIGKQFAAELQGMMDSLSRRHDDAAVRLSAIDNYWSQTHRDAQPSGAGAGAFAEVVQSAQHRRLYQDYTAVHRAHELVLLGQAKQALPELQRVAGPNGALSTQAYPLLVLSRALRASGQSAPADAALSRSLQSPHPFVAAYVDHAELMARQGQRDKAAAAMEGAFERFRKAPLLYVELIGFYSRHGRGDRAQELLNECVLTLPGIRELCADAARRS